MAAAGTIVLYLIALEYEADRLLDFAGSSLVLTRPTVDLARV